MNPMMAAIRKRKSGGGQSPAAGSDHEGQGHQAEHVDDQAAPHGKDLHGLVASLSDNEKHQLKTILSSDSGKNTSEIEKGAPSSEEQGKIESAMSAENQTNALEEQDDKPSVQSDDIGKSMLDSRDTGRNPLEKPRNLGERMRMGIASKLKSKGKM